MARLKNRNAQIPNGFKFHQPETNWSSPPWMSFDALTKAVIDHRKGNKYLIVKHKWRTDYDAVAAEVDAFNATICQNMGWNDFILLEANFPKSIPPSSQRTGAAAVAGVKKTVAGIKVVAEWLGSGLKPVEQKLAD